MSNCVDLLLEMLKNRSIEADMNENELILFTTTVPLGIDDAVSVP